MFLVYKPTQPPPALKHHAPKNTRTDSKSNQINMEEEKKQELATEGEEDDDGPPPGFQCIITPRPPQEEKAEADDDEEEEDGPPPGFHSVGPKSPPSLPPDMARSSKQDDIDDDEDGPPPGWEFSTLVNALPKPLSNTTDISDLKTESNDELDEGPPPGWETVLSHQMPPPHTPPLQPSTVSSNIEMGSKQNITRNDEVLPSVSQGTTTPGHSSPATPLIHQLPSSELPGDKGKKEEEKRSGDKRPTSGHQPVSPRQQLPSTTRPSTPATVASSSERAQLVCGTCRKLCLYPRGAKWVQCPGCREVNFVLEAHDIGQVKCGGCSVLLMYPHGAPAVQCTTCHFVTEIGAHNRRPPLSVQQAQAQRRRRPNRAH